MTRVGCIAFFALSFVAAFGVDAQNRASALDPEGKRVEVIVPFGEGGSTDTYTRFIAPKWHAFLPGKTTLVIRNICAQRIISAAMNSPGHRSQE